MRGTGGSGGCEALLATVVRPRVLLLLPRYHGCCYCCDLCCCLSCRGFGCRAAQPATAVAAAGTPACRRAARRKRGPCLTSADRLQPKKRIMFPAPSRRRQSRRLFSRLLLRRLVRPPTLRYLLPAENRNPRFIISGPVFIDINGIDPVESSKIKKDGSGCEVAA